VTGHLSRLLQHLIPQILQLLSHRHLLLFCLLLLFLCLLSSASLTFPIAFRLLFFPISKFLLYRLHCIASICAQLLVLFTWIAPLLLLWLFTRQFSIDR